MKVGMVSGGRHRGDRLVWSQVAARARRARDRDGDGGRNPLDWPWLRSAVWSATAFCVLVVLFRLWLPRAVPIGILLFGLVTGCISALLAVGLILVYRANRIINFAQAEIGVFGGILSENLSRGTGLPWLVSLVCGVAAAGVVAGVLEITLVRRFSRSPRLILTVATIGMAQLVVVLTYVTTRAFGVIAASGTARTPLSSVSLTVSGVVFTGDALLLLAATPVIVLAISGFLRSTDAGVAVRATADSSERAALLGVPVHRVSTVTWVVAGGLGALAAILRAPVVGLLSGSSVQGPGLLLRALTVAVLARMENLRVAVIGALLLGVVEQAVYFAYGGSTFTDALMVAIVIGALLARRRATARTTTDDTGTWSLTETVRPVPAALRRLPEVRWGATAGLAITAAGAVGVGVVSGPARNNLYAAMAIYAIVALSLVVLTGWAGQISLGQFGLAGLGAGVAGRLVADAGADLLLALLASAAAGAAAALVLGLASFRLRGFSFAVTSLSFAVAVETFFLNDRFFSWLVPDHRPNRPRLFDRFDLEDERSFYFLTLAVLALLVALVCRLRSTRAGRVLIAARDNDRAAASFGISPGRARLFAFAVSGAIAGIAGALLAVHQHAVTASAYSPTESLRAFSMAVIGGLGSVPGAIIGAIYVRGASFLLAGPWALLATAAGLLAILVVLPGGLARALYAGRDATLRRIAARRGIRVPSLTGEPAAADPPSPTTPAADTVSLDVRPPVEAGVAG